MSTAAKPFNVLVERITPTQDGNRLICVKAKQKRWALSAPRSFDVREGMTLSVIEDGAGRARLPPR